MRIECIKNNTSNSINDDIRIDEEDRLAVFVCFSFLFLVKIFFCLMCNEGDIIVISCAFDKIIRVSRLF